MALFYQHILEELPCVMCVQIRLWIFLLNSPSLRNINDQVISLMPGVSDLTPHEEYFKPGRDSKTRYYAYRELFKHHVSKYDIHLIENASDYCHPVGDDRFCKQIEEKYDIKLG